MLKEMKDIESMEEVNKICKQPNAKKKDREICYFENCPLFLGFCCYANIMFAIRQEIEVK